MRYVRLIASCDEYDSDMPGLALKAARRSYDGFMADRLGGLLAHDIVEHQNGAKNIGTVDDELEACGGMWHSRGRLNDFESRYYTPHQSVGSEIGNLFREQDYWMPTKGIRPHEDLEDDLEEIIDEARKVIKAESYDDEDLTDMANYLEAARRRFRIGYRKATRRFGSDYMSNDVYRNIRRALETTVKHIDYEGQEFILGYDRHDATVREVEYEYDF